MTVFAVEDRYATSIKGFAEEEVLTVLLLEEIDRVPNVATIIFIRISTVHKNEPR